MSAQHSLEISTDFNSESQSREVPSLPERLRSELDRRIREGRLELPLLPEAAALLLSMANDRDFDPQRLENVVRRDAAMAAHLLRIANSAAFAPRVPITSIKQAVLRLGVLEVRKISMLFTCDTKVFRAHGWQTEVRKLFVHSLATAIYAQHVAKLACQNGEEAFLAGLLHDIGAPVLFQTLSDLQLELRCPAQRAAVKRAVYERHAQVGATLGKRWTLSPRLIETISLHHKPVSRQFGLAMAAVVHLADDLARHVFQDQVEHEQSVALEDVLTLLRLTSSDLSTLVAKGREVTAATLALS